MVTPVVRHVDAETYAEVVDLLARHPHVFDNRSDALLSDVYTPQGVTLMADAARQFDADPHRVPFAHHTTDVVVHQIDDDTLRVWAKFFTIRGDGTAGSGDYQDTVVRGPDGWRIASRRASRGNRPDDDPDGPSVRDLHRADWLGGTA